MEFRQCGCLQLGIEYRSTLCNMLHMCTYTRCERELVNGYHPNFRANSSDLQFYDVSLMPDAWRQKLDGIFGKQAVGNGRLL